MKLIYLTQANLRDNLFVRDLVHNFKYPLSTKVLMLHEPFGETLRDTRFVTKRISTLFSETMTYNNAFMAGQRGLMRQQPDGTYAANVPLIEQLLAPINLLILGPIVVGAQGEVHADALALFAAARSSLPIDEVLLFPSNPMSPLGRKRPLVDTDAVADELVEVYEEETAAIRLAQRLRPAVLASPVNYAQ
jgi:hypothetical protein